MKQLLFCFKIGVPRKSEMHKWGDYYFARCFGEELRRRGHDYLIHILPQWNTSEDSKAEVVIHLRGLSPYKTKSGHFNIIWNISHCEDIPLEEYDKYDLILVASKNYAEKLKMRVSKPVYTLLQFVDTNYFYPDFNAELKTELLFVGNSRKVMRKIVGDVLPPPRELAVYGGMWDDLIPNKYIKDTWFPNEKLRELYSSCDILLNDHWEDMRKHGFINNRIFDAAACKAIIINDDNFELKELLPDALTYRKRSDLISLIEDIYKNREVYENKAECLYNEVLDKHTVKHRVDQFINIMERFKDELSRVKSVKPKQFTTMNMRIKNAIFDLVGYGYMYKFLRALYILIKYILRFPYEVNKIFEKGIDKITGRGLVRQSLTKLINVTTESEIKALARQIALPINLKKPPLVSIIVPNLNGLYHLENLMPNLNTNTIYRNFEVLIVDNGSTDGSLQYINSLGWSNCRVISGKRALNFSESINAGVKNSLGDYLVFLNNDTIPLYGWLDEMLKTFLNNEDCGVVGARMVYNELENVDKIGELIYPGCSIQHDGIKFTWNKGEFTPYNLGKYSNPLNLSESSNNSVLEVPAVSAACMLTDRITFDKVGGFDESYYFGKEDVDFCLKAKSIRKKIFINRRALLFHREQATQVRIDNRQRINWRLNNNIIFNNKWSDYLNEQFWKEKLNTGGTFWSEYPLKIAFLVTEFSPDSTVGDLFSAQGLGESLRSKYNYQIQYYPRRPLYEWGKIPESVDILMSMRHDFDIRDSEISRKTLKVAWIRGYINEWLNKPWINCYDGIIASSGIALEKARKYLPAEKCWGILPLGVTTDFLDFKEEAIRDIDVCFVGNFFEVPRDIVENLDLQSGFDFHFYGKLEAGKRHPWKPYHRGEIAHSELPELYGRTKIVIEDTAPFNIGTVNLRVYEAAACGALVITNNTPGLEEVFGDSIITYKDKDDLTRKIFFYLNNEKERQMKAENARHKVLKYHTFLHRAETFKAIISKVVGLTPASDNKRI